jgi:predicted porin
MKKTLVAVAALAASAAFAQSSVTLYGVADAYFGSEKVAGVSQTVVNDGGLSNSRIGVSVKEDLGAGLSAFAVIEGGVALDAGAGGLNANRKSVVGLSGDFGAVSLGRQNTPLENAIENTIDAQGNSAFSAVYAAVGGNVAAAGVTMNTYGNSVRYDSPNFDGFSGAVQIGLGENKGATTPAGRGVSLNLTYANGPVAVAFAHQSDKTGGAFSTTDRTTTVGGSYDFGPAKLNLGYGRTTDVIGTNDGRALSVGVTVPVGAFTVIGQYANAKVSNTAGSSKSFGLEGRYALSKRTTVYAGYNDTKQNIGGGANFKTNRLGVGIRHVF